MTFKVGDVVHLKGFGPRAFTIYDGPFRTIDCPGVDQYLMKDGMGNVKPGYWDDLLTPEEYRRSLEGEE